MEITDTFLKLHSIGAIRFGEFEWKRDFFAPFQVDLSGILSYPEIAKELSSLFWDKAMHLEFAMLAGGSVVSSCLANYTAWEQDIPFVASSEGKVIGRYKTGEKCLLLQDVDPTGLFTLDTIDILEAEGLVIRDVLTLIDLELGAKKKIKARGFVHHALFTISDVTNVLFEKGKLGGDQYKLACDFFENEC